MRTIASFLLCLCLLVGGLAGCSRREAPATSGKLQVAVGIPPIAYFAEKVGGELVTVRTLLAPGQSPHTFEPTPSDITAIVQANVLLETGWPFEVQLVAKLKELNPSMKVADLTQGIRFRQFTAVEREADEKAEMAEAGGKAQGAAAAHGGHAGPAAAPDPHIWLNPKNAVIMAGGIARSFAEADPAHAADYRKNADALTAELRKLDEELAAALAPLKGKKFMVYHPAFGYFADAYGLIQVPVEVEGKEPGPQQLVQFTQLAKTQGVKVIFVQPQFSARSAAAVAEAIGGVVAPMDDLAYDYVGNLREMARKVAAALKPADGTAR